MASEKLRKIAQVVKEITVSASQARYDIAGLTLGLCKFFYRTPQNLFQDLSSGDYTIDTSNNSQVLVIQNAELLKTMEAIQVCYVVDLTSSRYETDFNVDINQLKDNYNKLVDDVHVLWNYIKKVGIVADDTTIPLILPQLDTDEVWVKTEDGYKGISLTDAEEVIKGVITEYTNEMKSLLDQYVENPLKPRLDAHVEEVNKPELDRYVEEINKPDLDEYTQMLEERLQTMIDQAVGDKGLIPEGKDWFEIELGNWLVTDLFNKNYKNYPPQLTSSDNTGVVKKDISDGGRTQVIRYYTTTGKMFFAVRVNEVWSEWQEVGGSADSMQFTQANHGFVFTAVTLDGVTRKWTKATKYTGADGIAVKVDNDKFDVVIRGIVKIPTNARDDKDNTYVYDEYYFLSQDVSGGLTSTKPVIGTFQSLVHVSELDGKQVAYVDVGDMFNLNYEVLDSDGVERLGLATEKDIKNLDDVKQDKIDNNLQTDSKEIVSAINESLWKFKPRSYSAIDDAADKLIKDMNELVDGGIYICNDSASNSLLNKPSTYNSVATVFVTKTSAGRIMQLYISQEIGDKNNIFVRQSSVDTTTWGDWKIILSDTSPLFLGVAGISKVTYIQDSGTKTKGMGYIDKTTGKLYRAKETNTDTSITSKFEPADNVSNANSVEVITNTRGTAYKYKDGTMVCYSDYEYASTCNTDNTSSTSKILFPVNFLAGKKTSVVVSYNGSNTSINPVVDLATLDNTGFKAKKNQTVSSGGPITYVAHGRWK